MRNCPEIICIFQGASRCPLPAARYPLPAARYPLPATRYPLPKGQTVYAFAGSGQRAAVSVASLKMWKLIKDNS